MVNKQKMRKIKNKKDMKDSIRGILWKSLMGSTFGFAIISCTASEKTVDFAWGDQESYVLSVDAETDTESDSRESDNLWQTERISETETESETLKETEQESQSETAEESEQVLQNETAPVMKQEIQTETASSPEQEMESEAVTETEQEMQSETITEREQEVQSESVTEREQEVQSESATETEQEVQSEPATETEQEMESESVTEREQEVQSESATETEQEVQSEPATETEQEVQSETLTETEQEVQIESASETEQKVHSESVTKAEQEAQNKSVTETEQKEQSNAVTESEQEDQSETVTEREQEAQSETEGRAEAESDGENQSQKMTEVLREASKREESRDEEQKKETEIHKEHILETEKQQNEILRGQHYEIKGENYAWYRDNNDRLWIRKDSALVIEPVEGAGYNRKIMTKDLSENGTIRFQLDHLDSSGQILNQSDAAQEEYYVDGDVPSADILVEGDLNGNRRFSQEGKIWISVPPDAESGLKQTAYCIVSVDGDNKDVKQVNESDWKHCGGQESIAWDQEGNYRIYVRTEDHVGNVAFSKSEVFCVDHTPPTVSIQGIQNNTANSGNVKIQVECKDENGGQKLCTAQIRGLNNGIVIQPDEIADSKEGMQFSFDNLPEEKKYDDIYEMTVKVQDLAGNVSEEKVLFSVNRCGSVYHLAEDTRDHLQQYYMQNPFDLVIYETNIDYVGESRIFCRRDGILQELIKDRDYQVSVTGTEKTWKQYQYMIPSDLLEQEGVYEIVLTSRDAADNTSDTAIQEKKISFAIDRTSPTFTISGIKEKEIYETENTEIHLQASDNICLKKIRIYRDSILWKEYSGAEWSDVDENLSIDLEEKERWQTLQVYLEDASGNSCWSREIPFYLSSKTNKQNVPVYKKIRSSAEEMEKDGGKEFPDILEASFSGKEPQDISRGRELFGAGMLALLIVLAETVFTRFIKIFKRMQYEQQKQDS